MKNNSYDPGKLRKQLQNKNMTYRIVNGKVVVELSKTKRSGNAVTGGKKSELEKLFKNTGKKNKM